MELKDFINSKEIALYIKNLPPQIKLDELLFPVTKQISTEIEIAKGAKQRPVALRMSTFDVAAKVRALKADVSVEKKEMPFFKEAIGIKEKDRRDLILAQKSNNKNLVEFMVKNVFENYATLVAGADIQSTRMRAQLMQKGEINIETEDGDIVVDYRIPANHKEVLQGTAKWSDPTADIVGDIKRWQRVFTDEGMEKPSRLLITEKTFLNTVCKNVAITKDLKSRVLGEVIITDEDYVSYLKKKLGIEIAFLNGTFVNEENKTMNYYEDKLVTLIPKGTLGQTIYAVTPEEFDKSYGSGKIDTQVIKTGIAITTMVKEDPVAVDTKVSQIVIPSFERADECFFTTVS
ncbi:major capsid protein [Hathewaya histolytica]|uniref:Phage protein n=1 Tax=Hathewaya histolytica TaxID=1498 RepID=A0A4U9RCL7_HATHI|nr:major capsid protein [Hathewaya histolytica]VTQ88718.1 phage protein [Hathewaya histolytica]